MHSNGQDWQQFYEAYPRKVGKLAAERAYKKARKLATHEVIMDGLHRYIQTKPLWCEWAYPSSWLNAGRFWDDVAEERPRTCLGGHTPSCATFAACTKRTINEARSAAGKPLL